MFFCWRVSLPSPCPLAGLGLVVFRAVPPGGDVASARHGAAVYYGFTPNPSFKRQESFNPQTNCWIAKLETRSIVSTAWRAGLLKRKKGEVTHCHAKVMAGTDPPLPSSRTIPHTWSCPGSDTQTNAVVLELLENFWKISGETMEREQGGMRGGGGGISANPNRAIVVLS